MDNWRIGESDGVSQHIAESREWTDEYMDEWIYSQPSGALLIHAEGGAALLTVEDIDGTERHAEGSCRGLSEKSRRNFREGLLSLLHDDSPDPAKAIDPNAGGCCRIVISSLMYIAPSQPGRIINKCPHHDLGHQLLGRSFRVDLAQRISRSQYQRGLYRTSGARTARHISDSRPPVSVWSIPKRLHTEPSQWSPKRYA